MMCSSLLRSTRYPLDEAEEYVLDACVVIDFCGRTDSLAHLMAHVGDSAVITTAVQGELERQRMKAFPRLSEFLDLVSSGRVRVIDPDLADETAARVVRKWSGCFGAGEVSSAALAASRRTAMGRTVKARFRRGHLVPLEPVDLDEDAEVTVTILELGEAARAGEERFKRAAGGWQDAVDVDAFLRDVYAGRAIRRPGITL